MKRLFPRLRLFTAAVFLCSSQAFAQTAIGPDDLANFRSLDENFAEVARIEPLFAGIYVDGDALVYRLATKGERITEDQQRAVVAAVDRIFGETFARFETAPRRFETAPFAMADLTRWHVAMIPLQQLKGFVFSDLDERRSMLVLATREGTDLGPFREAMQELRIPLEAVVFETHAPVQRLADLRDRERPLMGGMQIGVGGFGRCTASLYFNFLGHPNFVRGMITNSHCGGNQGEMTGHRFTQPGGGLFGSNYIATEVADPPYNITHAQCGPGRMCRRSDSLAAHVDPPTDIGRGLIARIGSWGSQTISSVDPDYQASWLAWFPLSGEIVTKVGRTTGKTAGMIGSTCSPVIVGEPDGSDSGITMVCQYRVSPVANVAGGLTPIVGAGDSGSPVFALPSNPVTPNTIHAVYLHGILWGGPEDGSSFSFSSALNTLIELTPVTGSIIILH